jgi:hypothetical protein
VVEVTVGEQHGGRTQTVLAQHLGDPPFDADTRVDDDALLPRFGSEDVAVRGEGCRGKADRQHRASLMGRHHAIVTPS